MILLNRPSGHSFRSDFLAALTVTVTLVPQAIAYAMLAGLPPVYGLYAGIIPLFVYPLFGSSPYLSVGPVALLSIIIFATLSQMSTPGSMEYVELVLMTGLVAGLMQVLLGIFRMGFLGRFISKPVLMGFIHAAVIVIIFGQLEKLFGLQLAEPVDGQTMSAGVHFYIPEIGIAGSMEWGSAILGVGALLFILGVSHLRASFPGALIAMVFGSICAYLWSSSGVTFVTLDSISQGLPGLSLDFLRWQHFTQVIPLAAIIALISFVESTAISKNLESASGRRVDFNRELLGLGAAKLFGSFFQAYPSTGSFSRSAIAKTCSSTSGWTSIFAGLFMAVVALFGSNWFVHLPKSILAAVIIASVLGLIKIEQIRNLYSLDRRDFLVFLVTFILTLVLGIQLGVFLGITLSILMVFHESSAPHFAVLGHLPQTNSYRNVQRYEEAVVDPEILIVRYDSDLYFGNSDHFRDTIEALLRSKPQTRTLILDGSGIAHIDSSGIYMLKKLIYSLQEADIQWVTCMVRGPVRDVLAKSGILEMIGEENNYLSIADAVEGLRLPDGTHSRSSRYAAQQNFRTKKT